MNRIIISSAGPFLLLLSLLSFVSGSPARAAEDAPLAGEQIPEISVKDRVQDLRWQRQQQMPYLDLAFIRSAIDEDQVAATDLFISEGDKGLEEVLDRAASIHVPVRAARERISLSHRKVLVALRNLLPEAAFEWQEQDGKLSGSPFNSQTYKFEFRQPLFRGGALWNALLREKVGVEAARREYDAVIGDLINDVSAAYFEYHRAIQVAAGQARVAGKVEQFAAISERKFTEELSSEIEHLNVQSLASQVQYDYETAKQEVEIARVELQQFLDLDIDAELRIRELYDVEALLAGGSYDLKEAKAMPELPELVDLAYQNRPELRVESARLESSRFEEKVRSAELMPQADLVFEFGKTGEALDVNSVNPSLRRDYRLQLELNWNALGNTVGYEYENEENAPSVTQFQQGSGSEVKRHLVRAGVLDGLQDLVDAKEAEADRLDQIVELEQKEKEVILDVKQAYFDYQKAKIQVQSSVQRVNYRRRLGTLAQFRLEKNEIQISEFLQAEIDLLQELGTLHQALADYFKAKARMNRAIGIPGYFPIEERYGA